MNIARLNRGCGPHAMPGWINLEMLDIEGIDCAVTFASTARK